MSSDFLRKKVGLPRQSPCAFARVASLNMFKRPGCTVLVAFGTGRGNDPSGLDACSFSHDFCTRLRAFSVARCCIRLYRSCLARTDTWDNSRRDKEYNVSSCFFACCAISCRAASPELSKAVVCCLARACAACEFRSTARDSGCTFGGVFSTSIGEFASTSSLFSLAFFATSSSSSSSSSQLVSKLDASNALYGNGTVNSVMRTVGPSPVLRITW